MCSVSVCIHLSELGLTSRGTDRVPPSLFIPSLYIQDLFSRVQSSSFDVKFMQSLMDTFLSLRKILYSLR